VELSGWGMRLTTHLHLVPRLIMGGASLLALNAFVAWTETSLPFCVGVISVPDGGDRSALGPGQRHLNKDVGGP
jgi:hypothetical protein